ncbi:MAG: DUF1043 family protein [Pseudomonadota bacterium]
MDYLSLLVGLFVGAVIAGFVGWKMGYSKAKPFSRKISSTEEEIKQLINQQAQQHIETTKTAVETMQEQLTAIQEQLSGFESGLKTEDNINPEDTFYGEHASLFLRNSQGLKAKKETTSQSDNQPRDFSSGSSGVFAGESDNENDREETKEKGNG